MDNNINEIRDDEINVEEVTTKIRENIRRRESAQDPQMIKDSTSKICSSNTSDDAIQRDFFYIDSNCDLHNNSYFISSHHPYFGKFLVKGRLLVHGEVRRYVDPIISRQTELNTRISRILNYSYQKSADLELQFSQKSADLELQFSQKSADLELQFSQFEADLNTKLEKNVDSKVREIFSLIDN